MIYHLDGALMIKPEAMHSQFADVMDFPDYYGRNLDALWDLLTSLPRPYRIHFKNPGLARIQLDDAWESLHHLLEDLEKEEGIVLSYSGIGAKDIDPSAPY